MFDLRYHIASLAAVFVALAVGIVIGVAIAGGGNLEETTAGIEQAQLDDLNRQLEEAQAHGDQLETQNEAVRRLMDETYEPIMNDRLADRHVAVLYLGESDAGLDDDVNRTLEDAGLPAPTNVTALALPVDVDRISDRLASEAELAGFAGSSNLEALGEALGGEFAAGGDKPLWDALQGDLAAQTLGTILEPLDGVVLVRSWRPVESENPIDSERDERTTALIRGLVKGLAETGIVVVGVDGQDAGGEESSAIAFFKSLDVSSVDDVDTVPGRVGLALLLAGGEPGHYGVAEERIIPRLALPPSETVAASE
jgi:Copper transport outer membrane protein, MctB